MCEDPADRRSESLSGVIPDDPNMPYDVLDVVEELVDDGDFMQVHGEFARNIVVGFGVSQVRRLELLRISRMR